MSTQASSFLTSPQKVLVGYLVGVLLFFVLCLFAISVGVPSLIESVVTFVHAHQSQVYAFCALLTGLVWSAHIASRKVFDSTAVDLLGGAALITLAVSYAGIGPELMEFVKAPERALMLYVCIAVLIFPLSVFCAQVLHTLETVKDGEFFAFLLYPVAWIMTWGLGQTHKLSAPQVWTALTLHIVTSVLTLVAAYYYVRAVRQQPQGQPTPLVTVKAGDPY